MISRLHTANAPQVIELRYGLDSFRSDWRHCSLGSDFLADTSVNTPRAREIASTAINETLELAYRLGAKGTKSWVQARVSPGVAIVLSLDLKLRDVAELAAQITYFNQSPQAYYEGELGCDCPGPFFGLAYLTEVFGAVTTLTLNEDILIVHSQVPLRASDNERHANNQTQSDSESC
jgi:hypothetical protein